MAAPPARLGLRKEDFPTSGISDQASLDKLLVSLNTFSDSTVTALTGNLTFAENLNAEVKDVTVQTPPTDWTLLSLKVGYSNFGSSYEVPAVRKDAVGAIWVKGLLKGSAPGVVTTLPTWAWPAESFIINSAGNGGSDAFALLNVSASTGDVTLNDVNPSTFGSIKCSFPSADLSPGVFSCWPQAVSTKVTSPTLVLLGRVTAKDGTQAAPGTLGWTSSKANQITITNLSGLALGKSYTLRLLILGG